MKKAKSKSGKVKMRNKALFIGIIGIVAIVLVVAAIGANANNNTEASDKVTVPDVPHKINYQGYHTDAAGNPITGDLDMTFRIYDSPTGGTQLWSETQTSVRVENGLFNVILGSVNPIPGDVFPIDGSRWLETEVEGQIHTPRKEIVSVAYAFKADPDNDWNYTANPPHMFSIPTGNVGIGTMDPEEKLDVDGNVSVRGNALEVLGGPGSYVKVGRPELGYSTTFSYESDGSMYDTYIKNPCGRGGGCDLILDFPYGNVGIGTKEPGEKLDINGNLRFTEEKVTRSIYVEKSDDIDEPGRNLEIYAGDCNAVMIETLHGGDLILHGGRGYGSAGGGGVYIFGGDDGSFRKGDVILAHNGTVSGGNVGIGTSNPQNKLHVDGAINLDPITEPGTPSSGFVIYADSVDGKLKAKASTGAVTVLAKP